MQELFDDKIDFFKFFSRCDKAWLDQLKIITVLLLVVQVSRGKIQFHWYKKGEIPYAKKQIRNLNNLSTALYSANFCAWPTEMVQTEVPLRRHTKEKFEVWIWNVNMLSEIPTLNQEFQFEAWSNNRNVKIYRIFVKLEMKHIFQIWICNEV